MAPSSPGNILPPMRVRGSIAVGLVTIFLFFVGFGGWAATAPIAGAAIAPGLIKVDSNRKTVQHLEGGIISQILVQEGERVTEGQVLIRLNDTQTRERIGQLSGQLTSTTQQMALIDEEIKTVSVLLKRGLTQKPRLLALQRRRAELVGELADFAAQLRSAEDVLQRIDIRAPVSGIIVALQVHSVGGVIKSGETLLNIVPQNERLIVEAQVNPIDIDIVHAGLRADVRVTPYSYRNTPPVPAQVLSISADILQDETSGISFYLARIELEAAFLESLPGVVLSSGMPVEVMIYTGERTLLQYFLEPLLKSFGRAFRES